MTDVRASAMSLCVGAAARRGLRGARARLRGRVRLCSAPPGPRGAIRRHCREIAACRIGTDLRCAVSAAATAPARSEDLDDAEGSSGKVLLGDDRTLRGGTTHRSTLAPSQRRYDGKVRRKRAVFNSSGRLKSETPSAVASPVGVSPAQLVRCVAPSDGGPRVAQRGRRVGRGRTARIRGEET